MLARVAWRRCATVIAGAAVCLATTAAAAPAAPAVKWRPTIVLVTLDTTRADHLGSYGYPRQTSPFIDSLARQGVLFTRAFAAMSTTSPSHASMLTGQYPIQHKVRRNGDRLDDRLFTLSEWLRKKGYDTAAFVGTRAHFKRANFRQGFRVFNEPPDTPGSIRSGTETVAKAIDWLGRQKRDQPIFLWVHLFDAHPPYNPANRYPPDSASDGERLARYLIDTQRVPLEFFGGETRQLLDLMTQYDGQLRAMDRDVERLFAAVRVARPDSLWIITGDHGEGLGNHHWMEHGRMLYNEQLRAPLLVYFSSGRFAGKRVDCVVEHVDLFPTVADLLGAPLGKRAAQINGRSLVPLLSDSSCAAAKGYAFAQRRVFRTMPDEPSEYEAGRKFAFQTERYKYILWTAGPHEFYDLARDPYETTNLQGKGLPEEDALRRALLTTLGGLRPNAPGIGARADPVTEERLRALGYHP
jgi:arylsulfatase A-like enzyme